MQEHKQISL